MNISGGFKVVMARYSVSTNDLAKKLNTSNRAIQAAIGSRSIKKIETVTEMCEAIGCQVSELMIEAEKISSKEEGRVDIVKKLIANLDDENPPSIYALKDKFGKVIYIGQSLDLKSRLMQHIQKESFFKFSFRTVDASDLDSEEMLDIMKYNPELNLGLNSTEQTPSIKTLNKNISSLIKTIDFNPEISRTITHDSDKLSTVVSLITKEKHDYIINRIYEAAQAAAFDFVPTKEK